jgi:hypothetical protein
MPDGRGLLVNAIHERLGAQHGITSADGPLKRGTPDAPVS